MPGWLRPGGGVYGDCCRSSALAVPQCVLMSGAFSGGRRASSLIHFPVCVFRISLWWQHQWLGGRNFFVLLRETSFHLTLQKMTEFLFCFSCCIGEQPQPRRRRIDRSMIGEPMNFVHTAHVGSGEANTGFAMGGSFQDQMKSKGGYGPGITEVTL